MCCYREIKNFDRFIRLTQSIVLCTLQQLQAIQQNEQQDVTKEMPKNEKDEEERNNKRKSSDSVEHAQVGIQTKNQTKQIWSQHDKEKLFLLLSKIFLLNFPLYIAMKHGGVINPLAPIKVKLLCSLLLIYVLDRSITSIVGI